MVHELRLADYVEMPGSITDRDAFFNKMDVYLSTSVGEAFGLSVAEAMARGIPAVVSRVRGSVDVVEDGVTGFLFDLKCPDEMVRAVEGLRQDGRLYRRMSEAAVQRTRERFSARRMCDQVLEVYRVVHQCA